MIDRRTFGALFGSALWLPHWAQAKPHFRESVFYAAVGPVLTRYHVNISALTLKREEAATLPALVQYAWPHPKQRVLYVTSSNFVPKGDAGGIHDARAFRINTAGKLLPHGAPIALRARPVNMTVNPAGTHLFIAYNLPSDVSVHTLNADGTIGMEVVQKNGPLDTGIYAHQVRVMPSGKGVFLVTRGNNATQDKPEDPGAIKVFGFKNGQLTNRASIAPSGGYGFGPRHLDIHPTKPLIYVSLERENLLQVYAIKDGSLASEPLFSKTTLSEPDNLRPQQMVGPIHIHPNGRILYVGNRASGTVDYQGNKVAAGGENTIAAFAIDPMSGEPNLIQQIDTHGYHPRTFSLDPNAHMLVATNTSEMKVRDGDGMRTQPATLATYRIGSDGKLDYARAYDVKTGGKSQWWSGFVALS